MHERNKNDHLLTEDQYEKICYLSAIGWTDEELRVLLNLTIKDYQNAINDPQSKLHNAVIRGRLQKRAEIEVRIAKLASSGNPESVKQFSSIVRDKSFSLSKLDLFGGSENSETFERIRDYIASGSSKTLSEKEQIYVDILILIYSLDGQYGKRKTIKFLTSPPFNFSYQHATSMYAESIEMFFCNRKISKEALRQKMADQFDSLYIAARNAAQNSKDYEIAADILKNKAKVLNLDKDDPIKLPADNYLKQYRVLSLTPQVLGLPPADRQVLARQIDEIVAPDQVKKRLKMEAGVQDIDIIEILDNGVQKEN